MHSFVSQNRVPQRSALSPGMSFCVRKSICRNRYHVTEHGIDDSMISILMLDAYILCNIRKNNAIMTRTSGPPASLAVTLVS
jgi:hypothetical protein